MSCNVDLQILIFQKPSDPTDVPEARGSFWINYRTGSFFVAKEAVDSEGASTLSWFKEGSVSQSQFQAFFNQYAPLATFDQLSAGTEVTRVSITPALLRQAILAIAPGALTQTQFNQFLNAVSPVVTQAEAEAGTSAARRDFTPQRVKQAIQASAILSDSFASIAEGTFRATVNMGGGPRYPNQL